MVLVYIDGMHTDTISNGRITYESGDCDEQHRSVCRNDETAVSRGRGCNGTWQYGRVSRPGGRNCDEHYHLTCRCDERRGDQWKR